MKEEHQTSSAKSLIRGGQIIAHNIRMFKQVFFQVVVIAFIFSIAWVSLFTFYNTTSHQRYITYKYVSAHTFYSVGFEDSIITITINNRPIKLKSKQIIRLKGIRKQARLFIENLEDEFYKSLWIALVLCVLLIIFFIRKGSSQQSDKFLRGGWVTTNKIFKKKYRKHLYSKLSLGNIPIAKKSEVVHFEISGAPGSGKSQSLKSLIAQIKERGEKAIIYSSSTEFVADFYEEGKDTILNPLDERSHDWSPWDDAQKIYHYDDIAASLIPNVEGGSANPFWNNASRIILSNTMQKFAENKNYSIAELCTKLLAFKQDEIAALLKDTESARLVSEEGHETTTSIMSTLATYVRSLKFLRESSDGFSIRKWVESDEKSCLFITSKKDQHEILKPLISCWVNIFATSILSLPEEKNNRIWFIIDELPTLQRLKSIEILLAESRKYGCCCVLGFQSYSQLEKIYGSAGAHNIASLTGTKIFFKQNNDYNSSYVAKELGSEEVKAINETVSIGANTIRDGSSVNEIEKIRHLVLATEISNLPPLTGYYKLPGNFPVVKFKQKIFRKKSRLMLLLNKFLKTPTPKIEGFIESTSNDHVYKKPFSNHTKNAETHNMFLEGNETEVKTKDTAKSGKKEITMTNNNQNDIQQNDILDTILDNNIGINQGQ